MNRKRVLRVMRERGLLVRSRRRAGPAAGWAYLVSVIDCYTREIVSWNLSNPCRTDEAPDAVEQAVLARLPEGSREANVTLTTDNGTQFTSTRFIETLNRLGVTHRRTAYHHPEGNSYIELFHRSLKEEDRGVQSRPPEPRRRKSYPARSVLELCSCTKKRNPNRLDWTGSSTTGGHCK